jgi:hypothetical protein
VQGGGLRPLLELLESPHHNLQHNAAFALYGLSDSEDNVSEILKEGGLQRLMGCSDGLQVQASKVRTMRASCGPQAWDGP